MTYDAGSFDIAVIGAGHAGIEAALAAARLGCSTIVFTINLDAVGNCPCNPSIGGTAKGHLVREIDALGGEMGRTADACTIQSRMLNLGKGPAVHSLRAQIDRNHYARLMKHKLETCPNLLLRQGEIVKLEQAGEEWLLTSRLEAVYRAKAVIIATGTFLGGKVFVGDVSYESGPDGMFPAAFLPDSLKKLGISLRRFKTGTPARVLRSSIDFTDLEVQRGDEPIVPFSYDTEEPLENKAVCHVSWTNDETKQVILENIHRSPLYGGQIEGIGPRYCPSIEDKVVRFPDKPRHQLFIEPCGLDTEEMYLQGMSSSLPEDVQVAFYHTIPGLEHAQILRTAYAIEYDCCDPLQLSATLEFRDWPGLYGAGQFNGSSGYEEAAAQGFVAGVNAARKVQGKEPFVLDRASSYIGTLIDDLITKGASDPYRMMTSRSEYRLVLRQDNADERLTPLGRDLGLISDRRWEKFQRKQEQKQAELKRVQKTTLPPSQELNRILVSRGTSPLTTGAKLADLLKRPQITYEDLAPVDKDRPQYSTAVFEAVEIELKYEGYIKRQRADIEEARRLERKRLPQDVDYSAIQGLRLEAGEKLNKVKPENIGQAGRISGVSPADISVLLIWLASKEREGESMTDIRQELLEKAKAMGIKLTAQQADQFQTYMELLLEWNEKINLTAITQPEEVVEKHFLDSLTLLSWGKLKQGAKVIDVGTGAGFPGIPLKIARPDIDLTLLDGTMKRLNFLGEVCTALKLSARRIHKRAEEAGLDKTMRERYDVATARAVANLPVLAEYCMPLIKMKGYFIAMKGPGAEQELGAAGNALDILGSGEPEVLSLTLPGGEERSLVICQKLRFTPKGYPRHGGTILKHPL